MSFQRWKGYKFKRRRFFKIVEQKKCRRINESASLVFISIELRMVFDKMKKTTLALYVNRNDYFSTYTIESEIEIKFKRYYFVGNLSYVPPRGSWGMKNEETFPLCVTLFTFALVM